MSQCIVPVSLALVITMWQVWGRGQTAWHQGLRQRRDCFLSGRDKCSDLEGPLNCTEVPRAVGLLPSKRLRSVAAV